MAQSGGPAGEPSVTTAGAAASPSAAVDGGVRQAVEEFHALVQDVRIARETHRCLMEGQHAAGIGVHGQALARSLRPQLVEAADHGRVCAAASLLAGALQRLAGLALGQGEAASRARGLLALHPVEAALMAQAPEGRYAGSLSRLDGFITDDDRTDGPGGGPGAVKFVEYNAHLPMGALTQDALADIYSDTPAMRAFTRDHPVAPVRLADSVTDAVEPAWSIGGAPGDRPRVAIVECGPVTFGWEFTMLAASLARRSVPALICSTDDLRYQSGYACTSATHKDTDS